MATDPGRWGHSLANLADVWLAVLDAAAPRTIIEIGAYAGDVTQILVSWAEQSDTRIWSIDPNPQPPLESLAAGNSSLELLRAPSQDALPTLPSADAVIIDGDHNYYTVSEELRLVAARYGQDEMPLLICHDVCWPHARRDVYYSPELIPEQDRQPAVEGGYVFPGDPGLHSGGLPYGWPAAREGGPRNGVLTAIEDFMDAHEQLAVAIVPAFFGLAVIWPRSAAWADEVGGLLAQWDRNDLLDRLESNRVLHLAARELEAARAAWCQERSAQKDAFLRKLMDSKTFSVAVWLSRLRQGGAPAFSKDEVRELMGS